MELPVRVAVHENTTRGVLSSVFFAAPAHAASASPSYELSHAPTQNRSGSSNHESAARPQPRNGTCTACALESLFNQQRETAGRVTASVLAALLFVMQGITGTRDLLEIPLSWQKPAVYACDFDLQRCP